MEMKLIANDASPSLNHISHNDRILSKDPRRELAKRVIREELLRNWLHRKQLEEEVMTELFGEDMVLQRGKDSMALDDLEITKETCNKSLIGLQRHVHMQPDQTQKNSSHMSKEALFSTTVSSFSRFLHQGMKELMLDNFYIQGHTSLNGRDWHDKRLGNHAEGGVTGGLPSQCHPRAPNNSTVKMLIGLGKGASIPSISSVKKGASHRVDNVDIQLIGGHDETSVKTIKKRKHWECDLCNVITDTESVLKEHFNGSKHLKRQKASSKTSIPLTSNLDNCDSLPQRTDKSIPLEEELTKLAGKFAVDVKQKMPELESFETIQKFWCIMCKFGTNSEDTMKNHKTGAQHMELLKMHGGNVIVVAHSIPDNVQNVDATRRAAENDPNQNVDATRKAAESDHNQSVDATGKAAESDPSPAILS